MFNWKFLRKIVEDEFFNGHLQAAGLDLDNITVTVSRRDCCTHEFILYI